MSRGLGRIERLVLNGLEAAGNWWPSSALIEFAAQNLERPQTPAFGSGVRRALASLKRKGLVVQRRKYWKHAGNARDDTRREKRAKSRRERQAREEAKRYAFKESGKLVATGRLAKLLGLLGSAHDGEVVAAARKVEAERKRLGQTWEQLLSVTRL